MTVSDAPTWLDLGEAEFDRRRMPRGAREAGPDQAALFFAGREPRPTKSAQLPAELPGQSDIFDVLADEA